MIDLEQQNKRETARLREERKQEIWKMYNQKKFDLSQAGLICNILDRAQTQNEINDLYNMLVRRIRFGFSFDWSPEPAPKHLKTISVLKKDGEHSFQFKDEPQLFNPSQHKIENTLILGDNYDALANLLVANQGMIDVIYIDPPYNTGGGV